MVWAKIVGNQFCVSLWPYIQGNSPVRWQLNKSRVATTESNFFQWHLSIVDGSTWLFFFDEVEIFIYCFIPGLILAGSFETPNGWMLLLLFVLPYLVSALFRYVFKTAFGQTFSQYLKEARMRKQQEAQADSMDSREALAHRSPVFEKLPTSQSRQHHRLMDVFCFVLGPVLVVVNLLYFFAAKKRYDSSGLLVGAELYWIGIGVALIALGMLRRYWGKQN